MDFRKTFDKIPEEFDKSRPRYCEELFQELTQVCGLDETKKVLEIGPGTGQATEPVLKTGCDYTAIELGENFTAVMKEKFDSYSNFHIVNADFETFEFEKSAYDLVYSAATIQWIPEQIAFTKTYEMLKPGGYLAMFMTRSDQRVANPGLAEEIDKVYDKYFRVKQKYNCRLEYKNVLNYGFTNFTYREWKKERVLNAEEFCSYIGTHCDHIDLEEPHRSEFYNGIREAILKAGDKITLVETIPLYLVQKPRERRGDNRNKQFSDIPGFETWENVELLTKGWSTDKKYIVKTKAGEKLLLRIADGEVFEQKKKEYEIIGKYAKVGFEMSKPVAFGLCDNGEHTYMLLTWVEGEDLKSALPKLSKEEQYELGRSAGRILRQIHSIPMEAGDVPEQTKKAKKLLQLKRYEESEVRIADDETAVQYVKDNIDKLWLEPPVYMHGDFHPGNLILTPGKTLGVIDFNRWEVGDPYEEFYKLESFGVELSVPYCIGQIEAYFNDKVPMQFWETLAVYVAHASLFSIKWAEKFGQKEIDGMVKRCLLAMKHYDGFKKVIPSWYEVWDEC